MHYIPDLIRHERYQRPDLNGPKRVFSLTRRGQVDLEFRCHAAPALFTLLAAFPCLASLPIYFAAPDL